MDGETTLKELKEKVSKMRRARNWHTNAREDAISLCIETAELLEHFQWDNQKQNKEEVEMEVADVLVYLCDFANCLDIDLSSVLEKKLKKIDKKYPVEKILKHGDEFYYKQKKKYRKKQK